MSEMIERATRALVASLYKERIFYWGDPEKVGTTIDEDWRSFTGDMRAAIEKMEEPTQSMIAAAAMSGVTDMDMFLAGWRAAIREILKNNA